MSAPRPMVIGGMPRSGTTLLARLCRSHPDISITVELKSYALLGATYGQYARAMLERLRYVRGSWPIHGHRGRNALIRFGRNAAFVADHLVRLRRHTDGVITARGLAASTSYGAPIAADKYPDYVFSLEAFANEPDLLGVVIHRDPRDVASSFLGKVRTTWKRHEWAHGIDAAEIARRWVESVEISERVEGWVHVIRYEDLVLEPGRELRRLADWLGIDASGFKDEGVRDTSIGKYARGLTAEELAAVTDIAGPTMERHGYR